MVLHSPESPSDACQMRVICGELLALRVALSLDITAPVSFYRHLIPS